MESINSENSPIRRNSGYGMKYYCIYPAHTQTHTQQEQDFDNTKHDKNIYFLRQ